MCAGSGAAATAAAEARMAAMEAAAGVTAVGTCPWPAAAVGAGTMVAAGPASGGADDGFKADREAAAAWSDNQRAGREQGSPEGS